MGQYEAWAACHREYLSEGMPVSISTKKDVDTDLIDGVVEKILTPVETTYSKYGIYVRITDGTRGYVKKIMQDLNEQTLKSLILSGESSQVEFKETFKVAATTKNELPCLRDEIVKEIAAFMNTKGGTLIIGVNDRQEVVGLDLDYEFIRLKREKQTKKTKFEEEVRNYVRKKLNDDTLETKYEITIKSVDSKDVCVIEVSPSSVPVFVDQDIIYKKCLGNNQVTDVRQNFFVRTGPQVQNLDARKGFGFWKSHHYVENGGILQ